MSEINRDIDDTSTSSEDADKRAAKRTSENRDLDTPATEADAYKRAAGRT